MLRRCLLLLPGLLLLAAAVRADETPAKVDYLKQVKPILARHCFSCHGALRQRSGLRLDAAALIRRGGDRGAAIEPGNSAASVLIDAVTMAENVERMPQDAEPLSAEEIAILRAWIDQGAAAPDEPTPPDPRRHWSFQRPVAEQPPEVLDPAWSANPVDAFLAAAYQQHGLQPAPPAAKPTLLRRVYLDLVGLPPGRDELHQFLADDSPLAYEKVVDRLLASPRYGERWGRHWMDVWRYSDWSGYRAEIRNSQRHIWRWRDWIIESLNADKPYDRMVVEMLAGDELAPDDPDTLRATGYLARNWYKFNRNVWLQDTVEHTSKAFLGITMNCARCHDHVYDPVSQRDYYRFRAIFEPHNVRTDRVPGQPDVTKDGLPRCFDAEADAKTYLFARGDERHPVKDHPLEPAVPAVLSPAELDIQPVSLPPAAYYPGLRDFEQSEARAAAQQHVQAAESALAKAQASLAAARAKAQAAAAKADGPVAAPPAEVASRSAAGKTLWSEDFARANDERWKLGAGRWEFKDGDLWQTQALPQKCEAVCITSHPRDFLIRFRFTNQGGKVYHSVGLTFDRQENGDGQSVYLSAHAPEPKLQAMHQQGGKAVYPPGGKRRYPVKLDEQYTLEVAVQGRTLNASVNGELVLVYQLPIERREGRLSLWTYDAAARLEHAELAQLPAGTQLAVAEPKRSGSEKPAASDDPQRALAEAESAAAVAEKKLATARTALASVEARIAADNARYAQPAAGDAAALTAAAGKAERQLALCRAEENLLVAEQAHAAARAAVRPGDKKSQDAVAAAGRQLDAAHKAVRSAQQALEESAASYTPFGKLYPATSTGRRLALARWITDPQHPLTARVAVNHIWMRHFGTPLVPTVFDFGLNGKPPTHPKLLDYLAVELVRHGWSMKWLHRLLVTSRAYRLASTGPSDAETAARNAEIDPDNRYLWRFNSRRVEAEIVRDCVLHAAGKLDPTMGGPEIDQNQGQTSHRRSVYFRHAHEKRMPFLKLFDAASIKECYRRDESIIPQQALALANSPLALEQSRVLAGKLTEQVGGLEGGATDAAFVAAAYEQVLTRRPTAEEQRICEEFLALQSQRLGDGQKLTPFAAGPASRVKPSADPRQRARENLLHVLLNHNDFVTLR